MIIANCVHPMKYIISKKKKKKTAQMSHHAAKQKRVENRENENIIRAFQPINMGGPLYTARAKESFHLSVCIKFNVEIGILAKS